MKLLSEETLAHYGTPGMKKGVRHWQFPDGRFTPEGKERYFGNPKKRNINNLETLSSLNDKKGYVKEYFSKEFNNITKDIEERRKNEILDDKTGLYLKNNITTIEDDMYKVNPYYNINKGFKNNCSFCSITYIERRAGYDSVANYNAKGLNTGDTKKLSEIVFSKNNIKDSYYNPNYYKLETYKDSIKQAENILNKLQDGEASIISIYNAKKDTGGHYLNAEKRNGEILIIDPQGNEIYTFDEFKKKYNEWPVAGITNIDYKNLKFSSLNAVNNISHNEYKEDKNMNLLSEDTLIHYGIKGMKYGVRRWQYPDGRFNPEGKERYFGRSKVHDVLDDIKWNVGKSIGKLHNNAVEKIMDAIVPKIVEGMKKETKKQGIGRKVSDFITKLPEKSMEIIIKKFSEYMEKKILGNDSFYGNKEIKKGKDIIEKIISNIKNIMNKSSEEINKGKKIIQNLFNNTNDKKINKFIGNKIDKDLQNLFLNKNKYTNEEFTSKLNDILYQKKVYNENLKPKSTWSDDFMKQFLKTSSSVAGSRIGSNVVNFILGDQKK